MKKILFVLPHMICGGVEKALLALIHELPQEEYDISVMVVKSEGEFVELLPKYVHYSEIPLNEKIRTGLMLGGIKASLSHYVKTRQYLNLGTVALKVMKKDPLATLLCDFDKIESISDKYDIAICFHIHMPFIVRFVAEKVKADVKCAWIHNDFAMSGFNVKRIGNYFNVYNHFFVVSEQLEQEFVSIFPEYKSKTSVAHNIISEEYVKSRADEFYPDEYTVDEKITKILSIGRLDKQKGYDLAIKACKILKAKGLKFNWYVLGDGIEEQNIRKMIEEYGVGDCFYLLGVRINPYPYIKNCDIYVQPSKHEGYGIAVAEARMLNKLIVCTDFTGARDQIVNDKTGTIVAINENAIANAIEELVLNIEKQKMYIKNLLSSDKGYKKELDLISNFFNK